MLHVEEVSFFAKQTRYNHVVCEKATVKKEQLTHVSHLKAIFQVTTSFRWNRQSNLQRRNESMQLAEIKDYSFLWSQIVVIVVVDVVAVEVILLVLGPNITFSFRGSRGVLFFE